MTPDLQMLVWSAALAWSQMVIAAIGAQGQVGLPALAGNREDLPPVTGWAGRARRAHLNMLEKPRRLRHRRARRPCRGQGERDDGAGRRLVLLGAARLRDHLRGGRALAAHRGLGGVARRDRADLQPALLSGTQPKRVRRIRASGSSSGGSRPSRSAAASFAAAGAVWIPKPPCPAHQKKPGMRGSKP